MQLYNAPEQTLLCNVSISLRYKISTAHKMTNKIRYKGKDKIKIK